MEKINIPFKGWDLVAWINEHDGDHMIAVKPIAEAIGVRWDGQHKRILKDPRFKGIVHKYDTSGGPQEMFCLPVRQLNGWLYGINANRVKPEVRQRLLDFQEECHMHLHNALSGNANAGVVDALYKIVEQLQAVIAKQDIRISELEANQSMSFQSVASEAGRSLSMAKKTKHLRSIH